MYRPVLPIALLIACLAGVSLALPWEPVYDPWGWLVWGREVGVLALDTGGGPSWKPLPVVFTTAFAAFPSIAPELWLFVARAGWLAAVALAALLAARVAERGGAGRGERIGAAVLAAAGLVLLSDAFTPWLRQFAGGLSEPMLVALALAAVQRGLAGRHAPALAFATAACLIRPEAWPFLAVYSAWLWRREMRLGVTVAIATVLAVWFVPDLLGSGSVFTGADRAREGSGSPSGEAVEVLGRAAALPLAALWAGFALAAEDARRRGDRAVLVVSAGALAWIGLVAAMAAGGYAGLPRFIAPAAAVVCALGASGLAGLAAAVLNREGSSSASPNSFRFAAAGLVAVVLALQVGLRAAELPDAASEATALGAAQRDLAREVEASRSCGTVAVSAIEGQTAAAWRLEVPIDAVDVSRTRPERGLYLERRGSGWEATELGCPNFG